jgi:hypothetical protein
MVRRRMRARIERTNRALIHRGDRTHHQDQLIKPVSFRPINRIVTIQRNPYQSGQSWSC